jgi:hypothetical protein
MAGVLEPALPQMARSYCCAPELGNDGQMAAAVSGHTLLDSSC